MTLSRAVPAPVEQILDSLPLPGPIEQFRLEPRCRVCRTEPLRTKVNEMLSAGAGYSYIVRALVADNDKLDPRDRVTVDSVRNHCERHFPVQQFAKATYRDILERRAQESRVDFVQGVATALTPLAFLEVVMNAAFRRLVADGGDVSVETGLRAAEKLQSLLDKRDQGDDIAEMRRHFSQILDAVKSTVPEEYWGQIVARLDQVEQHPEAIDAETEVFDDDEEPYDPTEFAEDDDEF